MGSYDSNSYSTQVVPSTLKLSREKVAGKNFPDKPGKFSGIGPDLAAWTSVGSVAGFP